MQFKYCESYKLPGFNLFPLCETASLPQKGRGKVCVNVKPHSPQILLVGPVFVVVYVHYIPCTCISSQKYNIYLFDKYRYQNKNECFSLRRTKINNDLLCRMLFCEV